MKHTIKYLAGSGILGVSLAAFSVLMAAPRLAPTPIRLDPTTLCPIDLPITGHTIILIDRTDRFTPSQFEKVRRTIRRVRANLMVHARLSIYLITAKPDDALSPVFDLCNPGNGTLANPLIANPRRERERYNAKFREPLDRVLRELHKPHAERYSPIIETITRLGWTADFGPRTPNRQLIVVSDLLENVPGFSQYVQFPTVGAVLKSLRGKQLAEAGLKGVWVKLVYLRNPMAASRQGRRHLAFWVDLFRAVGANVAAPATDIKTVAAQ